ncbi:BlaI/MecI/CopY family transcriptional regulator [Spirosoma rhododendri]|uniref:BlaI/MecI/CopY family transcriptional regulator n=1 Tax=Spirosoma rhododendri TaxID=2728024 RepID=A0A7L5DK90_9BACT|nr:BlaI/MecI/CopY family transcriptional regulator [Spirosoma rhododendri]QJD78859.1 BlaI/MecI/CopY family transcriptional regulator [Spirosoma rhododendri]
MKLTAAEEILMHHLWESEKAFMKDILDAYDDPKPATTTVATLLKRLIDKGAISYREYGNSREYYPLVARDAYSRNQVSGLIRNFFNNSSAQFASFFATETDLSADELETLRKIVEQEIQKRKA